MSRQTVIDALQAELDSDPSYFRSYLLREDLERLAKLQSLAAEAPDKAAFLKAGKLVGWTPGDLRTHELAAWLDPFLSAWLAAADTGDGGEDLMALWRTFDNNRIEILAGCLSTRPLAGVPRP